MRQIGCYQLNDEPLARGGMGQIFLGKDPQGHTVVIKEILPEFANDWNIVSRIEKEVEFLVKIDHPSIVKLYSAFRDPQTQCYYIVMEYVEGENLEDYIARHGAIPPQQAVELMLRVLDALQCVHSSRIIHRDLKPSNIMVRNNGTICLLDFGVAKDMSARGGGTIIGSVIGTAGYMSPEQAEGYAIDYRSDIYSLGCVFYFMLTAHHAHNPLANSIDMAEAIVKNDIPPLSKYVKGLPAVLQTVIDKATQSNMNNRYQTCYEFIAALRNGTHISSTQAHYAKVMISVGREQCDITLCDTERKISRHHADIELVQNTGSTHYVFSDCSANGSIVNGKRLLKQQVFISGNDPDPEIYLAGVAEGHLDWQQVKRELQQRAKALSDLPADKPQGDTPAGAGTGGTSPDPNGPTVKLDPFKPELADDEAQPKRKKLVYLAVALACFVVAVLLAWLIVVLLEDDDYEIVRYVALLAPLSVSVFGFRSLYKFFAEIF
ncbi:MAG: protein kinase [Alloprevotella sp.]